MATLSITGPYRSGKSFLANLLMNQMSGFKTGSTVNACTRGLWVWGRPIPLNNGTHMIIMDSEGLGSVEKDRELNIDLKIFTLCVLMSTSIIYNTKHAISEDKIEELANVANLTKRINIQNLDEQNTTNTMANTNANIPTSSFDTSEYFPQLIWVLRDFSLDRGNMSPKEYLESCLKNVEDSQMEGAQGKNLSREIIRRNFKKRDCFTLVIPTTDENKLKNLESETKSTLRQEFMNQIDDLISKVKENIPAKKINNVFLDGEALFGLLQNYIESLNNNENPVILSALENVLLSKAKNISEKNFENFRKIFNDKLENKYPIDLTEVYREFFEAQDVVLPKFCESVNDTLSARQLADYIGKLFTRMRDELDTVLETNKNYYDEWFDQEYDDLKKSLSSGDLNKLEDAKNFFFNFSTELQNGLTKFLEIPNSDFCKNLINILLKILHDFVFEKLRRIGAVISDLQSSSQREINNTIDTLNSTIKRLQDQLSQEKKLFEEKNKEKSELNRSMLELETKYEKLSREFKTKEKEYTNNLSIEVQKYQKLDTYYSTLLKDKDNTIVNLEAKIDRLNKEISELNKEISNKTLELNRENTKLTVELERFKGLEKKGKTDVYDTKNVNLQSLFKTIQNIFMEFKDSVDKLDREKENVFKTKFLELSTKEIESKSRNWIEEIRLFREDQIRAISENYEKSLSKAKDELEETNFALTKANYSLNEEIQLKETYKNKYEDAKKEVQEYINISNYKDSIINTQKEAIKMYEDKIVEYKKSKEDLEISLNQNIVNFKMKEDELDTLMMVIEGILSKRRDKYDHNITRLSNETKKSVESLVKEYKLFK